MTLDELRARATNPGEVIAAVAERHGLTSADLIGPCRNSEIVTARCAAMYELRWAGFSLPAIGRFLKKDHSTVMYALRKFPPIVRGNSRALVEAGAGL